MKQENKNNPSAKAILKMQEERPEVSFHYHRTSCDAFMVCSVSRNGEVYTQRAIGPGNLEDDEANFVNLLQLALSRLDMQQTICLIPGAVPYTNWIFAGHGPFVISEAKESLYVKNAYTGRGCLLSDSVPVRVQWGSSDHRFLASICDEIPPPVDFSDCFVDTGFDPYDEKLLKEIRRADLLLIAAFVAFLITLLLYIHQLFQ